MVETQTGEERILEDRSFDHYLDGCNSYNIMPVSCNLTLPHRSVLTKKLAYPLYSIGGFRCSWMTESL